MVPVTLLFTHVRVARDETNLAEQEPGARSAGLQRKQLPTCMQSCRFDNLATGNTSSRRRSAVVNSDCGEIWMSQCPRHCITTCRTVVPLVGHLCLMPSSTKPNSHNCCGAGLFNGGVKRKFSTRGGALHYKLKRRIKIKA